jgi:hypothetical protein
MVDEHKNGLEPWGHESGPVQRMKIQVTKHNKRERGFLRLTLLLLVAMGACFWIGGQGVYTALKNRQPSILDSSDLAKGKPKAHWLVLTNCELQVLDSAYMIRKSKYDATGEGRITEAFIPIYSPGQKEDAKCYAVMATKDESLLTLLEEMRHAKTETAAADFMVKHSKELLVHRNVEGLVRFGAEESNGEQRKLAGLKSNLATDYIILSEGEKPNLGRSVGLLLLGVVIAIGLVFMFKSRPAATEY